MQTVAYQGESGAYSEQAVLRLLPDATTRALPTIRRVFEAVEVGACELGLVPLENSQAGSINETYDLLLQHGVHLVGEVAVPVDHCLLGIEGAALDQIREVRSHPQALAQCEEFLGTLGVLASVDYDTAGAARNVAALGDPGVAAVASARAAELYGLVVLAERIQNYPENATRFGVIARHDEPLGAPDKTSIVFGVGHVPGCLYRCLGAFAERHVNMVRLESRPRAGRPWEYVFYVDLEGPADGESMIQALEELSSHATFTRVLGSYAGALPAR